MSEIFYVLLIILKMIVSGYCFQTDKMHEVCGSSLGRKSGAVEFDASKLQDRVASCGISLSTEFCEDCPNTTTQIMFYFTNFYMPHDCKYIISFRDGIATSSPPIRGLSDSLCLYNNTLLKEKNIFSSTDNTMNIFFTRSDGGIHNSSATFTFVYSSFHIGVCDRNTEIGCSQGNGSQICTFKETVCSRKFDFCNNLNDTVCLSNTEFKQSNKTVKYILCGVLVIATLFAVKFFYHQYKKGERGGEEGGQGGGCLSRLKMRLALTLHDDRNRRPFSLTTSSSVMGFSSYSESSADRDEDDVAYISQTSMPVPHVTSDATLSISPSAPTLEEIQRQISVQPPPTYDESIVPSYNEVMAHKDKYTVR